MINDAHEYKPEHGDVPRIPIIECFGPTIQGEGIMTGTVTHFLRTGGCGLRCSWCDSMYAVDPPQVAANRTMMTTAQILSAIQELGHAPYITFTGGDPCIQKHLGDLIPQLNYQGMLVAVETQGQYFPEWLKQCDVVTFSPKGPSSGNVVDPEDMIDWLVENRGQQGEFRGRVCIKVVVKTTGDEFVDLTAYDHTEISTREVGGIETDLDYVAALYKKLQDFPSLYDAFYFTAWTPPYDPLEDPAVKLLKTVHSQRLLANSMLIMAQRGGWHFNDKVHLGCQQHVLLWPGAEKGV